MGGIARLIDLILRTMVLAALVAAALVALTYWLIRERRITPFGAWAKGVRRVADPALRPVEQILVRQGRNPQEGPFWLMAIVVLAGIALISLGGWLTGVVQGLAASAQGGVRGLLRFLLDLGFGLLQFALVVRMIGTWIGLGRYHRWMRPFYRTTDWLVEPISRRLPAFGMFDLSPLLALVVLLVAQAVVLSVVR